MENSFIYETKKNFTNSVDENGQKTRNLLSLYSKEHHWESDPTEFLGFKSIEDHEVALKNYIRSIGNSLDKTDLIHLTEFYALSDKDEETLAVGFNFDLIYDVKSNTFLLEEFPGDEDLSPIYEYFSNLNHT